MCEVATHLPQSATIGGQLEWLSSVPGRFGNPVWIDDCIDGILIYADTSALRIDYSCEMCLLERAEILAMVTLAPRVSFISASDGAMHP